MRRMMREDCDEYTSPLDELFERLEMREPDHIAVKYYKDYHSGSAKTLKSIQITRAGLKIQIHLPRRRHPQRRTGSAVPERRGALALDPRQ